MAPQPPRLKPKTRPHLPSRPSKPRRTPAAPASHSSEPSALFPTTKRDKREIKHSLLLHRIAKSAPGHKQKRRRPSRKLVTTLEGLADALPSAEDGEGESRTMRGEQDAGARLIRHKSMKSKPGAMKRREKMEKAERERFGKNMASLVHAKSTDDTSNTRQEAQDGKDSQKGDGGATQGVNRWAMLRGFIEGTMERREEFR